MVVVVLLLMLVGEHTLPLQCIFHKPRQHSVAVAAATTTTTTFVISTSTRPIAVGSLCVPLSLRPSASEGAEVAEDVQASPGTRQGHIQPSRFVQKTHL